MFLLLMYIH